MPKSRTLHALITLAATISLTVGWLPANAQTAHASPPAPSHQNQPAAISGPAFGADQGAAASAAPLTSPGHLRSEVFGFAFGNSSLADPTYGYPSWNFSLLSTVAYFGLDIQWDGTIIQSGPAWTTWTSATLTKLVAAAHASGTRVVLSINLQDFNGSPTSTMCAALHPLHRKVTIAQTLAQVQAMHVDGVNIDYEGLNAKCAYGPTTRDEMTSLVAEMRTAMPNLYLVVDTYAGAAADPFNFFNVQGMAPSVDAFFVMAYDMEYSNQLRAPIGCQGSLYLNCLGPTAPLTSYYYNDTTVMAQYIAAAGAGKVILGVPYYGRKACVAGAVHNAIPTSAVAAEDYLSASSEASDPTVQPGSYASHRDSFDGTERWDTWYNTALHCTRELYWDDTYSLGRKYDLVESDGLRGVGLFALQYGGGAPELWKLLASRFMTWTANYDLSQAPGGWQPGQTSSFKVTVTNTTQAVWPAGGTNFTALDLHFTSATGAAPATLNDWVTSQVFRLPADVAPGQSVVLPVTATAPATPGAYWLEAQMFSSQQFWFSSSKSVPARVAKILWFGTYDLGSAPTSWSPGQTQTFNVTVKNTGNQAWPASGANPVALDVNFAAQQAGAPATSSWVKSQIFNLPAAVAPGQSITISVTVTAPSAPGAYYLQAQLFKDHQFWFDPWQPVPVTVAPPWSASYNVKGVPANWTPGQGQNFTVFVTNTGSRTWAATGANRVALDMHFTTAPGGSRQMSSWLTSQIFSLPADIPPGGTAQIAMHVVAPMVTGPFYLEAELFKSQQFWFADFQPATVVVGAAQWSAGFDLSGVPSSWAAGQTQAFTVYVKNSGTATWNSSGANPVALDLHFTTGPAAAATSAWLTSQVIRLPADLPPGQTEPISLKVTAPASTGALYLEAEMFKDHQFWFSAAQPAPATVAGAEWWARADLSGVPLVWAPGQSQTFTVFVLNTGNELWPSSGANAVYLDLHFTSTPGGSGVLGSWMTSQIIALPSDIRPGQVAQIAVKVTAPTQAGAFYLESQMFKSQQFWIMPWQPVAVTVG